MQDRGVQIKYGFQKVGITDALSMECLMHDNPLDASDSCDTDMLIKSSHISYLLFLHNFRNPKYILTA